MKQFKKLEKIFNRNLANCLESNNLSIDKIELFNYIIEAKPQATFSKSEQETLAQFGRG